MGQRGTAPDDWDVEAVRLGERDCFRVRRCGALIGYAYTMVEACTMVELERLLVRHGPLIADLTEEKDQRRARA
jgi:hypothetical protein